MMTHASARWLRFPCILRGRSTILYQFHTQLLERSYLRQLVVKSVRVFHRLSAVPPTCPNRPRRVISRQNASRWPRAAGRNRGSNHRDAIIVPSQPSLYHTDANIAKQPNFHNADRPSTFQSSIHLLFSSRCLRAVQPSRKRSHGSHERHLFSLKPSRHWPRETASSDASHHAPI